MRKRERSTTRIYDRRSLHYRRWIEDESTRYQEMGFRLSDADRAAAEKAKADMPAKEEPVTEITIIESAYAPTELTLWNYCN